MANLPKGFHNSAEFAALLNSKEVREELRSMGVRAASAAGPGFKSEVVTGRTRAMARIYPDTFSARARERREHRLMIAQDALRQGPR